MNLLRAAVMVCDCQKGALVYFGNQLDANEVAYNMQRRMEANDSSSNGNSISFRVCADVEVGHCPACDAEMQVPEPERLGLT